MEILKQLGWAFLNTIELTFWTIKLLITKLISLVQKHLLPVLLIFFIGCSDQSDFAPDCDDSLNMYCALTEVNGMYELEWVDENTQTFAPIYVDTNVDKIQKIAFASDVQVLIHNEWFDLVNTASYTRDDGTTQTTLGVFADQINEIVNIYGGYVDDCGTHHTSHVQVKVVNKI